MITTEHRTRNVSECSYSPYISGMVTECLAACQCCRNKLALSHSCREVRDNEVDWGRSLPSSENFKLLMANGNLISYHLPTFGGGAVRLKTVSAWQTERLRVQIVAVAKSLTVQLVASQCNASHYRPDCPQCRESLPVMVGIACTRTLMSRFLFRSAWHWGVTYDAFIIDKSHLDLCRVVRLSYHIIYSFIIYYLLFIYYYIRLFRAHKLWKLVH